MFVANLLFRRFLSSGEEAGHRCYLCCYLLPSSFRPLYCYPKPKPNIPGLERASIGFAGIVNFSRETTVLVESVSTERAEIVVRKKRGIKNSKIDGMIARNRYVGESSGENCPCKKRGKLAKTRVVLENQLFKLVSGRRVSRNERNKLKVATPPTGTTSFTQHPILPTNIDPQDSTDRASPIRARFPNV